jgi:hypothetical protein
MNKIRYPCDRNSFPRMLSCQIRIINLVHPSTRHRVRSNSVRRSHCQAIVRRSKTSRTRRRMTYGRSDLFSQENTHKRKCEQNSFSEKKPRRPVPSTPTEKTHSSSIEMKSSSTLTFGAEDDVSVPAGSPPTTPENSKCEKDRLNEELNRQKAKLESIEEQRRSQQPSPAKPRERLPKPAHVRLTKST